MESSQVWNLNPFQQLVAGLLYWSILNKELHLHSQPISPKTYTWDVDSSTHFLTIHPSKAFFVGSPVIRMPNCRCPAFWTTNPRLGGVIRGTEIPISPPHVVSDSLRSCAHQILSQSFCGIPQLTKDPGHGTNVKGSTSRCIVLCLISREPRHQNSRQRFSFTMNLAGLLKNETFAKEGFSSETSDLYNND
jgi:hypothetical protein